MTQALICESRRGQQLQTLNLTEMSSLAEGEEVEELGDIVPSVTRQSATVPIPWVGRLGADAHLTL